MAMTEEQIRETEFINEIAELTLSIYRVLTQECCSECERPKFPQGMQAGDETKVGWSACVNEKCAAYGEQKASACYRFSERASAEQSAEIQQLLAFHSRKVEQRTAALSLQSGEHEHKWIEKNRSIPCGEIGHSLETFDGSQIIRSVPSAYYSCECGDDLIAALSLQSSEPVSELGEPRGTARHKPGCLWNETLPTGVGTWGYDCGLDLLLSQLEDFTLAEPSASGVVEAPPAQQCGKATEHHAGLRYSPSKPAGAEEWVRENFGNRSNPKIMLTELPGILEAYHLQAGAGWVLCSERQPEPSGYVKVFCYSRAIGQVPEDFDVAYYDPEHSEAYPWYVPSEEGFCHKARYTHWMKATPPEEPLP